MNKPTIQIKAKDTPLPFDINTIQTFDYNVTDLPDIAYFKSRIKQTIQSYKFDSPTTTLGSEKQQTNFNSVILQEIYKIQDMVNQVNQKLTTSDSSTISMLVDKLTQANAKTPEITAIETLLPEIMNNPDSFAKIIEISKKFNK